MAASLVAGCRPGSRDLEDLGREVAEHCLGQSAAEAFLGSRRRYVNVSEARPFEHRADILARKEAQVGTIHYAFIRVTEGTLKQQPREKREVADVGDARDHVATRLETHGKAAESGPRVHQMLEDIAGNDVREEISRKLFHEVVDVTDQHAREGVVFLRASRCLRVEFYPPDLTGPALFTDEAGEFTVAAAYVEYLVLCRRLDLEGEFWAAMRVVAAWLR